MRPRLPAFSCHAIVLLLALTGCNSIGGPEDLRIRIRNVSDYDLENVVVEFPGDREEYGRVEAGTETPYRLVERAYRYAYVEAFVGERKLVLQPIDYVGERLLDPGRYTYELDVETAEGPLSLRLVADSTNR